MNFVATRLRARLCPFNTGKLVRNNEFCRYSVARAIMPIQYWKISACQVYIKFRVEIIDVYTYYGVLWNFVVASIYSDNKTWFPR